MREFLDAGRVVQWVLGLVALVLSLLALSTGLQAIADWRLRARLDSPPRLATDEEQVAMLRWLHARDELPGQTGLDSAAPVLLDHSPAWCADQPVRHDCAPLWMARQVLDRDWFSGVPFALRRALVLGNRVASPAPDPGIASLPPRTAATWRWLFDDVDDATGWQRLRMLEPQVTVVLQPARAVVSPDGELALLLVVQHCEARCAGGKLYLFQRGEDAWRLAGAFPLRDWMPSTMGQVVMVPHVR
jgi:hypothetical protein